MMKHFYNCVIHPKCDEDWGGRQLDGCPSGFNDCDHCKYCEYIGTIGGEYYIDCNYDENDKTEELSCNN